MDTLATDWVRSSPGGGGVFLLLHIIEVANAVPKIPMAKLTPRDQDYSKWYNLTDSDDELESQGRGGN